MVFVAPRLGGEGPGMLEGLPVRRALANGGATDRRGRALQAYLNEL